MPCYEHVFIARQDISAAQVEALTESVNQIVRDNGGDVTKSEYWGVKSLAYRIRKNRKGHYSLLNIDAPAGAISELERNMRLNEDILRYMTIRVDELEEEPSVMMRAKNARDDRSRRGGPGGGGGGGRGRPRDDNGDSRPASSATSDKDDKSETAKEAAPEATSKATEESSTGDDT